MVAGAGVVTCWAAEFSVRHGSNRVLCPIRAMTGYHCPGCGGTRAFVALLSGHPRQAWSHDPLVFAAVPFAMYAATEWATSPFDWCLRPIGEQRTMVRALLAVVLGYGGVRAWRQAPLRNGRRPRQHVLKQCRSDPSAARRPPPATPTCLDAEKSVR